MKRRPHTLCVYRDAANEWRWTLWAPNKRIVADSGEGYVTRSTAMRAARRLHSLCAGGAVALRVDLPQ